ncbi:MAG: hypothetical protein ACR2GY_03495 [Phycisphaerales bacterium]
MPERSDWTPVIGLRNAAVSLLLRSIVAAGVWVAALLGFNEFATLFADETGTAHVPALFIIATAAIMGTIIGVILSRGLVERAGFTSPILIVMGAIAAALVIYCTEMILRGADPQNASAHFRFMLTTTAWVVACGWIVRYALIE